VTNGVATLQADSLAFGAATYLERSVDPTQPASWATVTNFVSYTKTSTLVDAVNTGATRVFYRIRSSQ
jgi:hypothetical protein